MQPLGLSGWDVIFEQIGWAGVATVIAFVLYLRLRAGRTPPVAEPKTPVLRCEGCGYDLRASSTLCPECGKAVPIHRVPLDPHKLRDDWIASAIARIRYDLPPTLRLLWENTDRTPVEMLADQLRTRGVNATVDFTTIHEVLGSVAVSYPKFQVVVPEEEHQTATGILQRFRLRVNEHIEPLLDKEES